MLINSPNLNCRMYETRYPEPNTPVMVHVDSILEGYGAYASLLEYNNIEGMIIIENLLSRRLRRYVTVGCTEPRMVLRVDHKKGYIDLSKGRLSHDDTLRCLQRYNKSCLVHSVFCHVADLVMLDLEDLYIHVGWPMYRKFGHAFEAFKLIVNDSESILDPLTRDVTEVGPDGKEMIKVVPALTEEAKDALVKIICSVMTPQPLKFPADIESYCFELDGVLHIEAEKGNNLSAQTVALEPKQKFKKPCEATRRSLRLQNSGSPSSQNRNAELVREGVALRRSGEGDEFHAAGQVPDLEASPDAEKMEEKIDFLVEAMDAVKSKVFEELPKNNLRYKTLYIHSRKKIEALEEENAKLYEKLDVARALLEEFNDAREVSSSALSKLRNTIDLL